jgi:hypothetical protein
MRSHNRSWLGTYKRSRDHSWFPVCVRCCRRPHNNGLFVRTYGGEGCEFCGGRLVTARWPKPWKIAR